MLAGSRSGHRLILGGLLATALILTLWFSWEPRPDPTNANVAERTQRTALARASDALDCTPLLAHKPLVVLALGQSNAGNHGAPDVTGGRIAVIHEGRCYLSTAPLPGATGDGGALWPWLVRDWQSTPAARPLMLSIVAVDATSIQDWLHDAALQSALKRQLDGLKALGVQPAAVLWQQGEKDAGLRTTREAYRQGLFDLRAYLQQQGVDAPVVAALSTLCHGRVEDARNQAIRDAIHDAVAAHRGILAGPDMDALDGPNRFDDCHFSATGQRAAGALWATNLRGILQQPAPAAAPNVVSNVAPN